MSSGDDDKGFRVTDRRVSASDDEAAAEADEESAHADEAGTDSEAGPVGGFPPIDFNTFVLSLSTSALVHLGEAPDPQTSKQGRQLALARQTIDLLGLLEDKTTGNLTGEEERLLSQVLYDLRMRFLAASKASG